MNSNENAKDNSRVWTRPPIWIVDQEAERLIRKYNNPDGKKLYCKALNRLPISRIMELESKAESGRHPGKLFTTLLSQELTRTGNNERIRSSIDNFRNSYGS